MSQITFHCQGGRFVIEVEHRAPYSGLWWHDRDVDRAIRNINHANRSYEYHLFFYRPRKTPHQVEGSEHYHPAFVWKGATKEAIMCGNDYTVRVVVHYIENGTDKGGPTKTGNTQKPGGGGTAESSPEIS